MVRMLAPILCYTADEIWQAMPHHEGAVAEHVMFNQMNEPFTAYALNEAERQQWNELTALRDDVNLALEAARAAKVIGKPLEADVVLHCSAEQAAKLAPQAPLLATLFIVSDVQVREGEGGTACANVPGVQCEVKPAQSEKCERCWIHDHTVGQDADHPTLCARCAAVVGKME